MKPRLPDRSFMNIALADLRQGWTRFWFRPESAVNLAAARIVVAGTALWIVLSRPDLPGILAFPDAIWRTVPRLHRVAYLLVFSLTTERILFGLLVLFLLMALIGWQARFACLTSGLLLYHFAPLETLVWTPDPTLRGLTLPTLGLVILSLSACDRVLSARAPKSLVPLVTPEHRWPIRLLQILMAEVYWFAGVAKLRSGGLTWLSAASLQRYLLGYSQLYGIGGGTPLGYRMAAHPAFCSLLGLSGIAVELLFPLVLVSRRAAGILVPLAFLLHVGIALLLHIVFLEAPLLLIFADWSRLCRRGAPAVD